MTETMKINVGFKISKNYNTVNLEIQDQPFSFENLDEFRQKFRAFAKILREETERQVLLIGTKEVSDADEKYNIKAAI